MERRFRLRHVPVHPMLQPTVKLAGGFAFDSVAFAEEFDSALKLSGSGRRLLQLFNRRQQLRELVLVKFFKKQGLLSALVLERDLVALTSRFSAAVHTASPCAVQFDAIR